MFDNYHVLCGTKNLLPFRRFLAGGKEVKLLACTREQLFFVLATNSIVIRPVNKASVEILQLALSERVAFDLKGNILFLCTKTGSSFPNFSVDVFLFRGLGDFNQAEISEGRVWQSTFEEIVERRAGELHFEGLLVFRCVIGLLSKLDVFVDNILASFLVIAEKRNGVSIGLIPWQQCECSLFTSQRRFSRA